MSSPSNFSDAELNLDQRVQSFYEILGVSSQSTQAQIRDAYRGKSKQCHPDTAIFDKFEAAKQFQALNQAYDTLRSPDTRSQYDQWLLQQTQPKTRSPQPRQQQSPGESTPFKKKAPSAFLESEDRPLSPGEIFALFILGLTFLFCLLVAIFLGVSRGEMLVKGMPSDSSLVHQLESFKVIPKEQKTSSARHPNESGSTARFSKITQDYSEAVHKAQQNPSSTKSLFPTHTAN